MSAVKKMWEGRCDDSTCSRWRWVSQHTCQQCRRLRSLAKARHLPQGIGGILEIYSRAAFYLSTAIKCGRGLAPDSGVSANTSTNCAAAIEASLKLDISHIFNRVRLSAQRRLLTSAGTSSPAMRLRNSAVRASSNVVTGTVIANKIGISHPCSTGPDLSTEK